MSFELEKAVELGTFDYLGWPVVIPLNCMDWYIAMDGNGSAYLYSRKPFYGSDLNISTSWSTDHTTQILHAIDPRRMLSRWNEKFELKYVAWAELVAPKSCMKVSELTRIG